MNNTKRCAIMRTNLGPRAGMYGTEEDATCSFGTAPGQLIAHVRAPEQRALLHLLSRQRPFEQRLHQMHTPSTVPPASCKTIASHGNCAAAQAVHRHSWLRRNRKSHITTVHHIGRDSPEEVIFGAICGT